jgi:ATP-dependent DNA helicase RecQ
MEYLRQQLDDPAAAPCGRCDNCTGRPWAAEVSPAGTALAQARLLRPGLDVTPRRMWPPGLRQLGIDVSGKITPDLAAEPGRALGRLTGLGWGVRLRAVLGSGAGSAPPDEPVPEDLVAALVQVLAGWEWAQRPAGVITLPSHTRPQLIASLGERIASVGRLPLLGSLGYVGAGPGPRQFNSPQRLAAIWRELLVPGPVCDAASRLDGPVLLIDDRIETGWTMTVAAKLLREAGAPAVLPLVLAVTAG